MCFTIFFLLEKDSNSSFKTCAKLEDNILKSECFLDRLMYNVVSCFLYLVSVLDKACVANDLDLENKLKLRDYQRDICKQ